MIAVGVRTLDDVTGKVVTVWHAPSIPGPDYETLCCTDANDRVTGTHGTVRPKPGQKIDCVQCHRVWAGMVALQLKAEDFTKKARET